MQLKSLTLAAVASVSISATAMPQTPPADQTQTQNPPAATAPAEQPPAAAPGGRRRRRRMPGRQGGPDARFLLHRGDITGNFLPTSGWPLEWRGARRSDSNA